MISAYIGLGSNLGDSINHLKAALEKIPDHPRCELIQCSALYRSKALTLDSLEQPDYLNAVCEVATSLSAEELLDHLQAIETDLGRTREKRWGARTIDLDILLYSQQQINTQRLSVPHPQMHKRNFVLQPLLELTGDIEIVNLGSLNSAAETLGWKGLERLKEEIA